MNVEEMKSKGLMVMECVAGSHMYGTNIATSDRDIRGLFRIPPQDWVCLFGGQSEISENNEDTKYYELRRYMELLMTCNPTVLEYLWVPQDCLLATSPIFQKLVENRLLFVTSKAFWSHTGYAFAQIKKAKGKNKKVNRSGDFNDEDGVRVLREWMTQGLITLEWVESRFCEPFKTYLMRNMTFTPTDKTDWKVMDELLEANAGKFAKDKTGNIKLRGANRMDSVHLISVKEEDALGYHSDMPFRPFPVHLGTKVDLRQCHVAAVEHVPNTFRLYDYGPTAKGVFRDGQIVCESIPKEDEHTKFIGLLVFNKQDYERERTEYKSYWEWMAKRNDARWVDQEQGTLDYDQKNMMHTIRLLMSVENILRHGEPIVRFTGNQRDFLMQIRTGAFSYEEMLAFAECRVEEMEALYKVTLLPHSPNTKRIAELYKELATMGW